MKRRLNLFCALGLLVLSWSVIETGYYFLLGVRMGVEEAKEQHLGQNHNENVINLKNIHLLPNAISIEGGELMTDSIYNAKSHSYVPAAYSSLAVSLPIEELWSNIIIGFLSLAMMGLLLSAIIVFVRLIVAINRSQIFCWENVKRLRKLGIALLLAFACLFIMEYLNLQEIQKVLEVPGYAISLSGAVSNTLPVLGLCSLIVAEVFAIGLKMKEEQDLTI